MVRCSVCIATYKRPDLLNKLLLSLEQQILPSDVEMETLVVDNDAAESARQVCEKFLDSETLHLTYLRQPLKSISLTRNMAVKYATGPYLLFIDDDEFASFEWIATMLQTIETHGADGVVGAVLPDFHPGTPNWMKKAHVFNRPLSPTGTTRRVMSTSNCMVKASLLKTIPGPFDPRYGLTGGEDVHLFNQLYRAGAKFVSSREAWVKEYVPPERTTLAWMFKRTLRSGNSYVRRQLDFAGKRHLLVRLATLFKTLVFTIVCVALAIVMVPSPQRSLRWLLKGSSNIGQLLAVFGLRIQEY